MISVSDLTLTYPSGKGVFDLDFSVAEGSVAGYLGPNGAGKTTTIRALLGFMRPDSGKCLIDGMDCSAEASQIQHRLGYLPGEIAFPDGMDGVELLTLLSALRGTRNGGRRQELLDMFELDPKGKIRKFSKGMKQKLAIVAAFMHDPDVLVLDEPSSGLDPLMQHRLMELIFAQKAQGKTILMSSHVFEEVEKVCDSVLIIKEGRLVAQSDVGSLMGSQRKLFVLTVADPAEATRLLEAEGFPAMLQSSGQLEVAVPGEQVDRFVKTAAKLQVLNLDAKHQTLEDIFIGYYRKGGSGQ